MYMYITNRSREMVLSSCILYNKATGLWWKGVKFNRYMHIKSNVWLYLKIQYTKLYCNFINKVVCVQG